MGHACGSSTLVIGWILGTAKFRVPLSYQTNMIGLERPRNAPPPPCRHFVGDAVVFVGEVFIVRGGSIRTPPFLGL